MKQRLIGSPVPAEEPQGTQQVPTRLSECGDTLSIRDLCGVLGISIRTFRELRAHGAFIEPLPHLSYRWSKAAVQRYLDGQLPAGKLRRMG